MSRMSPARTVLSDSSLKLVHILCCSSLPVKLPFSAVKAAQNHQVLVVPYSSSQ